MHHTKPVPSNLDTSLVCCPPHLPSTPSLCLPACMQTAPCSVCSCSVCPCSVRPPSRLPPCPPLLTHTTPPAQVHGVVSKVAICCRALLNLSHYLPLLTHATLRRLRRCTGLCMWWMPRMGAALTSAGRCCTRRWSRSTCKGSPYWCWPTSRICLGQPPPQVRRGEGHTRRNAGTQGYGLFGCCAGVRGTGAGMQARRGMCFLAAVQGCGYRRRVSVQEHRGMRSLAAVRGCGYRRRGVGMYGRLCQQGRRGWLCWHKHELEFRQCAGASSQVLGLLAS